MNYSTIETGPTGLACTTAAIVYWRVRKGAILVQRWAEGFAVFDADKLGLEAGKLYTVQSGKIKD